MNKEIVTKINHEITASQINYELKNLWRPISELSVIYNNLTRLKAHPAAAKIKAQIEELESMQYQVKKELLGIN